MEIVDVKTTSRAALLRLLSLLPHAERYRFFGVVGVSVLSAIFETAGVASILPFMAVVMSPTSIFGFPWLAEPLGWLGVTSSNGALLAVGMVTIVVLALGNASSALNLWSQQRFIARLRGLLSVELFAGYMRQPYSFHVQRDAASLIKVAFSDVEAAVSGFVSPLLAAIAKGLVALVILALLVAHDSAVALGAVVLLGGSYWLVYRLTRRHQNHLGIQMSKAADDRSRSALEGLGGIKELRVLGRETEAVRRFADSTMRLTQSQAWSALTSGLPRYCIEVVAFGGIVGVTLGLVLRGGGQAAVPTLALYAFAGYRLMPAFQQLFGAAIAAHFNSAAIAVLDSDIRAVRETEARDAVSSTAEAIALPFERQIRFDNVCFAYPGSDSAALRNVSLVIARNETIGLVGRTGSGKTTLVDLLLGLYSPTSGALLIDGVRLGQADERGWRRRVGYVPQNVFLANATVAQNIAFGLPDDQVNMRTVEKVSVMAQASEFIEILPRGYDTLVGERGVRLSGGQRQRLGIARALYHDPDVLVFDEATSALDGQTEDAVMSAIRNLRSERTIVLIAHRLQTVCDCDRIIMLENGEIVAEGDYKNLVESSSSFIRLAGKSRTFAG